MSIGAVCVRCGATRSTYDQVCPSCGLEPEGDGLLMAWLLSSEHLDAEQLDAARSRIEGGEHIRPTPAMLKKARKALKVHFSTDPGLPWKQRMLLMMTCFLLTPLVGWTLFAWWRRTRPRAAWQSAFIAAPMSALFFVAMIVVALQ